MKQTILLIVVFHFTSLCFSQSRMAFIKEGFKKVNAYNSTKTSLLVKLESETYFYCDSLEGNWYKLEMPFYIEGYIHKDSIQFFQNLSKIKQKQKIIKALINFYSICKSDKDIQDSIYYTLRNAYYLKTYYPILEQVFEYYKETKDTSIILNLLNSKKCNPDGEFATTFNYLVGYFYDIDKHLFVDQIIKIKSQTKRSFYKEVLFDGIHKFYFSNFMRVDKGSDQADEFIKIEINNVNSLIEASR